MFSYLTFKVTLHHFGAGWPNRRTQELCKGGNDARNRYACHTYDEANQKFSRVWNYGS
jgi:hypothetical protein